MSEPMHTELCNAQCPKLASILKERLVELAGVYAQHLERIGWYAAFSPQVRLDIANRDLEAMIAALEAGNTRQFVELISSQAAMRIEQDFNYFDFIEALSALEKVLLAAIQNIDEAGVAFVWQALAGAREVVFGLTAERFGTSEEQFREIVSRSMVGIFRMALDGEVLDANPAML
ncbi:MAG: hypothetical protein JW981_06280, partial [Anaerolineae bacterium]|nr:hypothetical protein [Anaerolineae bacterium]